MANAISPHPLLSIRRALTDWHISVLAAHGASPPVPNKYTSPPVPNKYEFQVTYKQMDM